MAQTAFWRPADALANLSESSNLLVVSEGRTSAVECSRGLFDEIGQDAALALVMVKNRIDLPFWFQVRAG